MKKGYWLVRSDVKDFEKFKQYAEKTPAAIGNFEGKFIVRAGDFKLVEGQTRSRHTLIEFPSYQAAKDCWESQEYQSAKVLREGAADLDIVIIEGFEE